MSTQDMNTQEETTAVTVRALNDALNARDREATVALFASDGVFRPGAAGTDFAGPEAIARVLSGDYELRGRRYVRRAAG